MMRRGMALIMVLVFATLLAMGALAFSKMFQQSRPQNQVIDERVKIDFLAQGYVERALLKYQLFPADFYAAAIAQKKGVTAPLKAFIEDDPVLQVTNFAEASATFSTVANLGVDVVAIDLLASWSYNSDAIRVRAVGTFQNHNGQVVSKDVVRILKTERKFEKPF